MRLHFHEPPAEQRIGGLDAAIRCLQAALENLGHVVTINPGPGEATPEAAHFHGLWQRAYPGAARRYRAAGVPVIVSPHGMLEPWAWRHKRWKKFPYWHLIESRWVRRAACVLATAKSEARRLAAFLPAARIEVRPLGLTGTAHPDYSATRLELGWAPEEFVLLFLSRLHEKKGLDLLLLALAEVCDVLPRPSRLVIVGPEEQPAYAEQCREIARAHAARLPAIEWKGPIWGDARWPYLQGADLFCLPTHSENFGLVVLEACQVGTPVLTTTGTPWGDVLGEHGGYIAEPRIDSLAAQLRRCFAAGRPDPLARPALAQWARATYAWDGLAENYADLYRSLAQTPAPPRPAAGPR